MMDTCIENERVGESYVLQDVGLYRRMRITQNLGRRAGRASASERLMAYHRKTEAFLLRRGKAVPELQNKAG